MSDHSGTSDSGTSDPGTSNPGTSNPGTSNPGPPILTIRPWIDPVVDDDGHDVRSRYVETFWLGVLGPTATWLVRRFAAGLDTSPEGYDVDLSETARAMGLSFTSRRSSPFSKALQRCVMFGLAHPIPSGLAVRRRVPAVAFRHLRRMPEPVQRAHADWIDSTVSLDDLARAHHLALAMREVGDDDALIEHHLVALGIHDSVAATVADNLSRL
jgi:hypothetical protein